MRARLGVRAGVLAATALAGFFLSGCSEPSPLPETGAPPAATDSRLVVYTVNYPLRYFAERIGGDLVRVEFPAPPESDPAFWAPDAETVAAYQAADIILLNGAGYARWIDRATLPLSRLIDTSAGFKSRYVPVEDSVSHSHGPQGEHSHGEVAFTTWLDPALAVAQAEAILEAFVRARPGQQAAFRDGFASLQEDLQEFDGELEAATSRFRSLPILFSHPVYQYLARRYELNARALHWEPDEVPEERQWQQLQVTLREHPARWIIWEGPPREDIVQRLHALGVESLEYDPCGNVPESGDFLSCLHAGTESLERIGAH